MSASQIEGVARVVAADGGTVWLEPEPTGSCSGCMSAAVCGHGNGSSRRMASRRFALANQYDLRVGERVVIGMSEASLLRASLVAYGLPLLGMIGAAITAQVMGAGDGRAALATLGGLAVGLVLARLSAGKLSARGDLTPRYLRRATGPGPGEACHTDLMG